ncbi:uncharacterized protein LOC128300281 [Anopheles moucheti]|uniref:uncharacterized protein LOC128300281 n=1 Tax=Anopheles moucheti TaxID=186751 RepID=UPI0022EFEC1A|nr:uncharacterized protein LOC128300281 [Anopheles moucheti]
MKQLCILLAVLLCTAAVADAISNIRVYATTCEKCKSIGAVNCGNGYAKLVSCDGQTAINNCGSCTRRQGRCSSFISSQCFL